MIAAGRFVVPESEPKARGSFDRSVPLERTLEAIPEIRRHFGITRVGDTTRLDRTGIPTMCAVVPRSPDVLSVYNGKGLTREAALASAVMEAAERQTTVAPNVTTLPIAVREVGRKLDLDVLELLPEARDLTVECAYGTDVSSGTPIAVPMALVQFPWDGDRLFRTASTNGLASGNTPLEALYHALSEMIERHVWSLSFVRSELVPRFYRGPGARHVVAARLLRLPCGDRTVDALAERIRDAGLTVRVLVMQEGRLPPVALATIAEPDSMLPMIHQGFGCSLSPTHAVVRALTEAAQSRVTDIQGARDDLLRPDGPGGPGAHGRRPRFMPTDSWDVDLPAETVSLADIADRATADLARDVRVLLELVECERLGPVVAVDVSHSGVPVSVVRIVAPQFETAAVDGRFGPRARRSFNPFPKAI